MKTAIIPLLNSRSGLRHWAMAATLLLTTISLRAGTITIVPLPAHNTDLATGITTNKTYVSCFDYGSLNATTYSVNGVPFTHVRTASQNVYLLTNWVDSTYGGEVFVSVAPTNHGIDVTTSTPPGTQADGNMLNLLNDQIYNGNGQPALGWLQEVYSNLTIGDQYSLRIYYRAQQLGNAKRLMNVWFNGEGTPQPYSGNPLSLDTNAVLQTSGANYIEYDFTASGTTVSMIMTNINGGQGCTTFASSLENDSIPYAPFITYEPVPTVVGSLAAFTNMDFNVTAIGTPTLTYQWYYNTVSNYAGATMLTDGNGIVGSTTANLTTTQNLLDDYFVVVANNYGSITSSIVAYNPNPTFIAQPSAININNSYVQYSVTAQGVPPLTYQWYLNTSNSYSGATALTDGNGYSGSATASLNATTNLQDYYFVVVANNYSSITSSITLYNPLPAISSQPSAFRIGNSIGMAVTASGWPTLAYQWYLNTVSNYTGATAMTDGGGISGSQTVSVTINNELDYYFVVVTNYYGSATSQVAAVSAPLTVVAAGEPIWNTVTQTNVCVYYSAAVDPATATALGNYSLSGGSISSAVLAESNEVVLTTSPLSGTQTLTVQNVNGYYEVPMAPSSTNLTVGRYPANIVLWLKANTGISGDGYGGVVEWNDLSGYNNDLAGGGLTNGVPPTDPLLATNAWGDPVVRFSAASGNELEALSSPSLAITNANGSISIIAVVNFATLAGGTNGEIVNKTGVSTLGNIPAPYDYYVEGNTYQALYRGNGGSTGDGSAYGQYTAPNGPSIGVPHVLAVSESGALVSHYLDGNLIGTGVLNGNFNVATLADQGQDLYVGGRSDSAQWLSADLAELIVAASSISTYDVTQLTTYLAQEHNVTLPGTSPPPLSSLMSANQLTLSWPTNYTGWTLQAQTNSLSVGLSTNWSTVSGSTSTNQIVIPISTGNGSVFYRLIYAP